MHYNTESGIQLKFLFYSLKEILALTVLMLPFPIAVFAMLILQGDYNFKPDMRLMQAVICLISLLIWDIIFTIIRISQGGIRSLKSFFHEKHSSRAMIILGTYLFLCIPLSIFYVCTGKYSIIYFAMFHIVILIDIFIGIKLIGYDNDYFSEFIVAGWLFTGFTTFSLIKYLYMI